MNEGKQVLGRLVSGIPVEPAVVDKLGEPWLGLARVALAANGEGRLAAVKAALAERDDGDEILRAILAIDPSAPQDQPSAAAPATLPPFPIEALPPLLGAFVADLAVATQTPLDLAGMAALGAVSAAIAGKITVQVKRGWREPVGLYVAVALGSGERKSPVFAAVTHPLEEFERWLVRQAQPEIAAATIRRSIADNAAKDAENRAMKAKLDEQAGLVEEAESLAAKAAAITVPVLPQLIVEDVTPEKLAAIMAAQDGRVACLSDEGGIFDILAGRYSSSGIPNIDIFLKGHDQNQYRVNRVDRRPDFIRRPSLTVCLCVQPDVLRGLAKRSRALHGRGLLARFLYAVPVSMLGSRDPDPPPVDLGTEESFTQEMSRLLNLEAKRDDYGDLEPHLLRVGQDAYAALLAFTAALEPRLGPGGDLSHMSDWAGKLAGHLARIAGLLHVAERVGEPEPWAEPIDAETMGRALRFADYLVGHGRQAYALMGAGTDEDGADILLHWIKQRDLQTFNERDALRGNQHRFADAGGVHAATSMLVAQGKLEQVHQDLARAGRPPSPTYRVLGPGAGRS